MAERPTHVDIGPHRYAVRWDQPAIDRERVRMAPDTDGNIRYASTTICVDGEASASYQREVLLHEIMHGVLNLTGGNRFPKGIDADGVLFRLDAALLDTLQRNPHVVAWLMESERP